MCFHVGCQTFKEGIVGKRKSQSADELLIKKKNPLVLPPDFEKLPVATSVVNSENIEEELDIQKIIGMTDTSIESKTNKKLSSSLEEQILKKIKNN